jgi:hypothetical protein
MKTLVPLLFLLLFSSCGLLTPTSAATAQRLYQDGKITKEEYDQLTGGSWVTLLTQAGIGATALAGAYYGAVGKIRAERGPVAPQSERQRRVIELQGEKQQPPA